MPQGGYRRPQNPAPYAGPGSLSRRTDGGPADKQPIRDLPNAKYGEQAEFRGIQQSAPMAQAAPAGQAGPSAVAQPLPPPLDAPTGRPEEPVTAGANAGAGPGQDILGLFDESNMAVDDARYVKRYLPMLQFMVDRDPRASASTRALVRHLRSV